MYVSWKFPHCPRTTMKLPSWQLPGICTMATWNARPLVNQTIETKKSLIYHDPLGKGFMCCFPGKASVIITWSKSIWTLAGAYPKLWNNFIHRSSTLRSPASLTILWQVVGNSATSWVWIPADVAHCCSKMVKRCWKMMRSKWYQI